MLLPPMGLPPGSAPPESAGNSPRRVGSPRPLPAPPLAWSLRAPFRVREEGRTLSLGPGSRLCVSSFSLRSNPPLGIHCSLAEPDRQGPGCLSATPNSIFGFSSCPMGLKVFPRRDPGWLCPCPAAGVRSGSDNQIHVGKQKVCPARPTPSCSWSCEKEIKISKALSPLLIR